jgi:ubiquinone/menaquinone biosynthesis C-methylase UbiE
MRRRAIDRVPENSAVLDLGCGTGELALALRRTKNCRVTGIDLSKKMIDFAKERSPYPDVTFECEDAVALVGDLADGSFDVAVATQLLHEINEGQQIAIIKGMFRVAGQALILDWKPPLSVLGPGVVGRVIEGTIGRDHHAKFLAYLEAGGILGLVEKAGMGSYLTETVAFDHGVSQLAVLSRA